MMPSRLAFSLTPLLVSFLVGELCADDHPLDSRIPRWGHNLLLDAKVSGNLVSFEKGLRGAPDDLIYDVDGRRFLKSSGWHEYGVGFGANLGVVSEDSPAWWMAEWKSPVEANCIVLNGAYPNQPQPTTAWKIELRENGDWRVHARGVGGWYDDGRYIWGGPNEKAVRFDALRVSLFSKDKSTPLKSIHFRGEEGVSWIVALCAPINARFRLDTPVPRATEAVEFSAESLLGDIKKWRWKFGDGEQGTGSRVAHTYDRPGTFTVTLEFSDGIYRGRLSKDIVVGPPVEARIKPLSDPVLVGKAVTFQDGNSYGKISQFVWDFGDGSTATGSKAVQKFAKPGIYNVGLTVSNGPYHHACFALVRVHTSSTVDVPQVLLDTDQKNEQDDQHYLGYAVFSELDLLGVNSVHHGGGQEAVNYAEIVHVLDLAKQSGVPSNRIPRIFRGADRRLAIPDSGQWFDTEPIVTEASEAILAAARGASPDNPVWVVPVGPGTNVASAILMARRSGLELKDHLRVMWLGGSDTRIGGEFNGNNDPWSMYVVAQSGLETWIMPAPVGARVRIDKRTESDLYADNPLGRYLRKIVPAHDKALYDPACLAAIISQRLQLGWIKETEPITVLGTSEQHRWLRASGESPVLLIRQIDQAAMKQDIFDTMKGKPHRMIGVTGK